jgi:hypothetical protein
MPFFIRTSISDIALKTPPSDIDLKRPSSQPSSTCQPRRSRQRPLRVVNADDLPPSPVKSVAFALTPSQAAPELEADARDLLQSTTPPNIVNFPVSEIPSPAHSLLDPSSEPEPLNRLRRLSGVRRVLLFVIAT